MNTLQICSYYTDSKLYYNLFKSLEDLGEGMDVFYFTDKKRDISQLDPRIISVNNYYPWERLFFFRKHRKVYRALEKKLDLSGYSHSHAHSLMSNGYIANKLYRDYGLDYMVAVRRTDLFFFMKYKPYLKGLAARILKEARAVIFLSPVFLDKAVEIFSKYISEEDLRAKSHILPNGIDQVYFDQKAQGKKLEDKDGLRLVFIGKVEDPNKNVKTLFKLLDKMNKEGKKVTLKLIGSINKDFQAQVDERPYLRSTGRLSPEEIIRELKEDHIFIMPSYTETFGLVYVEAMSQGLPVIYTRGQGFDGQFKEGQVGYGAHADSIEEMEEAIGKIESDYEAMSLRAIEGAKRFNWQDIAKDYQKIYQTIRRS